MDGNKNAIVGINMDISKMETSIISALEYLGLPKTEIFSDVKQRKMGLEWTGWFKAKWVYSFYD